MINDWHERVAIMRTHGWERTNDNRWANGNSVLENHEIVKYRDLYNLAAMLRYIEADKTRRSQ